MPEEKILDSEKLEDEQLDQVAGGNQFQMEDDINRFKSLGILSDGVDKHDKDAIKKAFAAYGITADPHGGWGLFGIGDNEYYRGGKKISREEAWADVMQQAKTYRPTVK